MKKNILTITLAALGALILVMPTLAATTVSFSPASVSVKPGQNFNVSVVVNPQGTSNYVEKVVLNYPADLLQVNSFTLGSTWMALTQPGYDLTDNTNGVLIKSAGYPNGFSSATTFGTVSFYAKKAGSGTITIGSNSLAFEVNSQSALSGSPVSITIKALAVTAPKPTTPAPTQVAPAPQPITPTQPAAQPVPQPTAQTPQPSLIAAIGGILTLGTGNVWLGIIVGFIILAIIIYAIYSLVQKKKQKIGKL